jgi:hypothetical protein
MGLIVGALWRKHGAKGQEFFAGEVNSAGSVLVVKNKYQHGPSSPDYVVMQSDGSEDWRNRRPVRVDSHDSSQEFSAPFVNPSGPFDTNAFQPN